MQSVGRIKELSPISFGKFAGKEAVLYVPSDNRFHEIEKQIQESANPQNGTGVNRLCRLTANILAKPFVVGDAVCWQRVFTEDEIRNQMPATMLVEILNKYGEIIEITYKNKTMLSILRFVNELMRIMGANIEK
jgi:hypothetical protein